ncbi:MAG: hypothetical protein J0H31_19290, partial [Alphaproteobacteria bacterium]|nr:hypothetical protein [Alphaproteobacteria bacterium]
LLSDMREQTRLSVVAGMFHDWDKQLREWLVREIMRSFPGSVTAAKIWSVKFDEIAALLEGFGWNVRSADYFRLLDACRLVVNVYKHGKGPSFDELKSRYPEYLADPFDGVPSVFPKVEFRDHRHLKVTDAQFQAFSDAILRFWRNVPENTFDTQISEVPDWFGKAIMRDRDNSKLARKTGRTGSA